MRRVTKRNCVVRMRVRRDERKHILRAAREVGLTLSEFVRQRALGPTRRGNAETGSPPDRLREGRQIPSRIRIRGSR
jgi:hypothetical protein